MKSSNGWMVVVAALAMGWGTAAWGASGGELVLGRQGSWSLVQADGGTVKSLFLERDGSDARTRLATVEVPSATVTNVYWDEFAGWDAETGRAIGGMVTNVDTVAGEYTFHAFVNDGNVYWEDRADGVPRLWTAPCKSPGAKTLLATGDAGCPAGTSAFRSEPWNRGAAWTESGADGGTMAVFEDGTTTRLASEAMLAARGEATRKGVEEYEKDYGYWTTKGWWYPPYDGWQSEFHDRQTVAIPNGVTRIGMGVFAECTNLTGVTIPNSVTNIVGGAFWSCASLTDITIPDSVTSIGWRAFGCCTDLKNVVIGSGVTSFEGEAFYGCNGLKAFSVASGNPVYQSNSGFLLTKDGTTLLCGVNGDAVIPDGVTSIEGYAFRDFSGLTSVTIPDCVQYVWDEAFSGCSGLTNLVIGNGTTMMGYKVFSGCSGLENVTIPDNVTSIGWGMFSDCTGMTNVTIGNGVESIAVRAFSGCSGLENVTIPDGVTALGMYAFSGCTGLKNVTIGNGVSYVADNLFSGCSGLTNVVFGNGVRSIGYWTFSGCSALTSVTIPDGVTSVGFEAFSECSGLKTLSVPGTWEGTDMLDHAWGDAGKPEGCVVVYRGAGDDVLPEAGDEAEVATALAGAADGRLGERIRSVEEYEAFRSWVSGKGLDAGAVMGSAHAWISYALGAEGLFENEPEIVLGVPTDVEGGERGRRGAGETQWVVDVSVKDGGKVAEVDAAKVAALFECTGNLSDWTGAAAVGVSVEAQEGDGEAMRFLLVPEDEKTSRAFLRIGE